MNKKKKSIGRMLFFSTGILVVIICLLMVIFGFTSYVRPILAQDQAYLRDILQLTIRQIDPDDMDDCIQTKQKSNKQ